MPKLRQKRLSRFAISGELILDGTFLPGPINTVFWDERRRTVCSLITTQQSVVAWSSANHPPRSILFDTGLSTARPNGQLTIETVVGSRSYTQVRGLRGGRVQVPPGHVKVHADIFIDRHGHLGTDVFWPLLQAWIIEGWQDSSFYDQYGRNVFNVIPGVTVQIPEQVRDIILYIPQQAPPIVALFQFGRGVNSLWNGTFTFTGVPQRVPVPDAATFFLLSGVDTDLISYQYVY